MSRPRLNETGIFGGCRDRDSLRPGKSMSVETETNRDWAKDVENETLLRVSLISALKMWQTKEYFTLTRHQRDAKFKQVYQY